MTPFTERVIAIIKQIPSGTVMTYGQIAAWAGSPRAARQVVRILHSMSKKYQLPWHRVINSQGKIRIKDDDMAALQMLYLQGEGVEVSRNRYVDLKRYQLRSSMMEEDELFRL